MSNDRQTAVMFHTQRGKWGMASFTSTRAIGKIPGQKNYQTPQQAAAYAYEHPDEVAQATAEPSIAAAATTPKPRKFFKSRTAQANAAAAAVLEAQSGVQRQQQHNSSQESYARQVAQEAVVVQQSPKPVKTKHSKKKSTAIQEYFVQPPPPPPAAQTPPPPQQQEHFEPPPPALFIPQPSETIPSKRYLARARKVQVNYNEDENSQPIAAIAAASLTAHSLPPPPPVAQPSSPAVTPMTVPMSAISPSMEHPPIVLRISKGTSRLVSTDSEEANNASPPHQTFASPSSFSTSSATATNGVVKETRDSFVQQLSSSSPTTSISNRATPRKRRSAATAAVAAITTTTPDTPPGQPRRTTRAIRRQQEEEELRSEQEAGEQDPAEEDRPRTPQPGSENYDLYRTLASSPEVDEVKVQAGPGPSVTDQIDKEKEVKMIPEPEEVTAAVKVVEEVVEVQKAAPAKRGRKKKVVLVEKKEEVKKEAPSPPQPEVMPHVVPVEVVELVPVPPTPPTKPVPGRRGRKPKAVAVAQPTTKKTSVTIPDPIPEPPVVKVHQEEEREMPATPKKQKVSPGVVEVESPRRSTRGAATATTPNKAQAQKTPTKVAMMAEEEAGPKAGAIPSPVQAAESPTTQPKAAAPVRSYGRKRKGAAPMKVETVVEDLKSDKAATTKIITNVPESTTPMEVDSNGPVATAAASAATTTSMDVVDEDDKPLVKLVISKKKGSIFKSRALASNEEVAKNRPVYKHKWDVDGDEERNNSPKGDGVGKTDKDKSTAGAEFDDFEEVSDKADKPSTVNFKPHRRALLASSGGGGGSENAYNSGGGGSAIQSSSSGNSGLSFADKQTQQKHAAFYTVKQAHQIQEIGEFQEMDDDVEYILDTLQPKYPILTRCLSAMQLSTKCMTPEFRMHVRAHGTVTQFFRVLQDAPKDRSLALCTASIMFVLAQDNIGMDLDRDSLELMLNLLECDEAVSGGSGNVIPTNSDDVGLTEQQAARNKMKVRELCEEVKKGQGKAVHLNLDNVTVGALAMETLLSLTSKRAGEWFKEELRNLGGLEHIVRTVCECCRQISDYVAVWTEGLLEKLRKIERCLRVLDNVMEMNETNQSFILKYDNGGAINVLVKLYKLCDTELALYPTVVGTPKDNPGVAIREALVPTLKVLISLTHSFSGRSLGAAVVGEKTGVFDTSLHLLFHSSNYVPENCVFELSILVLLLLTNMTMQTAVNRAQIMEAHALSDFGSQFAKVPAIKALVEFFYKCEESARLAEENADAILDAKPKKEKSRKGDEIEETVTKILQKAGNHMEHTIMASYVCILIGHLVMHDDGHRRKMSAYLRPDGGGFAFMAKILEKYYNFMNLTASAEALTVAHIEATKKIIDYLTQCDGK